MAEYCDNTVDYEAKAQQYKEMDKPKDKHKKLYTYNCLMSKACNQSKCRHPEPHKRTYAPIISKDGSDCASVNNDDYNGDFYGDCKKAMKTAFSNKTMDTPSTVMADIEAGYDDSNCKNVNLFNTLNSIVTNEKCSPDNMENFHSEINEIKNSTCFDRLLWVGLALLVYLCLHNKYTNRILKTMKLKSGKSWTFNISNILLAILSLMIAFPLMEHVIKPLL